MDPCQETLSHDAAALCSSATVDVQLSAAQTLLVSVLVCVGSSFALRSNLHVTKHLEATLEMASWVSDNAYESNHDKHLIQT